MSSADTAAQRRVLIVALAAAAVIALLFGGVTLATHVLTSRLVTHFDHFPALAEVPRRAVNAKGLAGDPLNVAIVGSDSEIATAFRRAGWTRAVPVTRASSIAIARSVLLHRPDSAAPVSPLFLYARQQDGAFEREVGRSASRRHHVRLWRVPGLARDGRPVWVGGATFDLRAGISHRGLHPTHHIAPDVDDERDTLVADLARTGEVDTLFRVTGLGVRRDDHNAEGDRFFTDGEMAVLVLSPGNATHGPPVRLGDPWLVRLKDWWWRRAHPHH